MSIITEDYENIVKRIDISLFEGKCFLISGATGFIGGHIVRFIMYMYERKYINDCTVIALCRNKNKAMKQYSKYVSNDNFHLLIKEITDSFSSIEGNINYIIHAASISNTSDFNRYPADLLVSNIVGTWRLLELSKTKSARLLFLSSGAVYGEIPEKIEMVKEDDVFINRYLFSKNSYSTGKRGGEALCCAYNSQYGTYANVARISHTYGPLIDLNDGKVFSDFIQNILKDEDLLIKSDGLASRPYCYITDTIIAIFYCLFYGKAGEAYNIANPYETFTVRELADKLALEIFPEKRLHVKYLTSPKYTHCSKKTIVSIEKIKELGWTPIVSVEDGFRRTVESFCGEKT